MLSLAGSISNEQLNLHLIKIDYMNKQNETLNMKAEQVADTLNLSCSTLNHK